MAAKPKNPMRCAGSAEFGCRRNRTKNARFCKTCQDKKWRAKYPMEYAFKNLRNNAKRRNIPFSLTFEQFCEFCEKTEILKGRGRTSESLHIDRKIDELGYSDGNLQPLTNRENVLKEHERRKATKRKTLVYDWQSKTGKYINSTINQPYTPPEPDSEVPF